MQHNQILQEGIKTLLKSLTHMLSSAVTDTSNAAGHMTSNDQNAAIGAILALEESLEKAMAIYRAIIALHRFNQ
jgi:hypothetical protein